MNGHDHEELKSILSRDGDGKPIAIIANTIKGKGCKTMEDDPYAWHHRAPSKEELERMLVEVEE